MILFEPFRGVTPLLTLVLIAWTRELLVCDNSRLSCILVSRAVRSFRQFATCPTVILVHTCGAYIEYGNCHHNIDQSGPFGARIIHYPPHFG